MTFVSIVIPVCNEAESVPELHRQIAAGVGGTAGSWEFIFVDDGSRDETWKSLEAIAGTDRRVPADRLPGTHRAASIKRTFGLQMRQSAVSRGMVTLSQAAWQKAQVGETSLEELLRVLPPELR